MIVRLAQGKGNIDQDTMFGILQFPSVVPVYDPTKQPDGVLLPISTCRIL